MENIAPMRKSKYFSYSGAKYIISDYVKDNIKFMNMNLMEPYQEKFFDIILCRNVIIYFTRELQKRVMGFFYDSLSKNGILILGKTETMLIDYRNVFQCINIKERIFRKT
jgi:chemotaxis protein methyltransferase CheR